MLTNKWILMGMSLAGAIVGWGLSFNGWSNIMSPSTAGIIVGVLSSAKVILNALAPAPGAIVTATNSSIITHTSA